MPNDNDTRGKIKLHKNPSRNNASPFKHYVPQYQVHGVEPQEYRGAIVPSNAKIAGPSIPLPLDNPRAKRAPLRQPYAEAVSSPIGRGRGPVPNVGNNMEHTWSSVDGDMIVDDLSQYLDPDHPMVDNNDFVSDEALGFQSGMTATDLNPEHRTFPPQAIENEIEANHQSLDEADLLSILSRLVEDSYLLIVSGVPICSGPQEEIEDQARALVFGEHEMCEGHPVPLEDIIVIKRSKVKLGLFLE